MGLTRRSLLAGMALPVPMGSRSAASTSGDWIACTPAPVARSEVPAASLDDQIYVVGGFGAANLAHRYDPETDSWTELANLPMETNHAGIAVLADRVIVAGGYSTDATSAHDAMWALDPRSNVWDQIGQLPHKMGAFGFSAIGPDLYVAGGALDRLGGNPTEETWRWNPETDVWSACSPLPRIREHLAMVASNRHLFAIGGRVHGGESADLGGALDIYDPELDSWIAGDPLPVPRSGLNGTNSCDGIAVAGGETPSEVYANVNLFDPVTGVWSELPDLPEAAHGMAVSAVGSQLFAMGGSTVAGTISNSSAVWKLSLACDSTE